MRKNGVKRAAAWIMSAAMSLSVFGAMPTGWVSAETGETTYEYEGYTVDYAVTGEWSGTQTVRITVTNTGEESILNWALEYDAEGEISDVWNGEIYSAEETEYIIKNTG